uniref:Uncharacterized protein n=1 Tax=Megaselia scalaris TaxID=36166 RepID=T1GMN8_MEGSC
MSPLYATPPHSPTSELGSPMQLPLNGFDDYRSHNTSGTSSNSKPDSHFARDTHMRIILGNLKEQNQSQR